jgi:death on curing protein
LSGPTETRYLSVADVISLQRLVLERMGSVAAPLRDAGALESAVMRPRMAAYYEQADLIRQAVLLPAGISQAQAFVDGNKRAALAAADVFLRLNGLALPGEPLELARQLEALAERSGSLAEATARFEAWIRERLE